MSHLLRNNKPLLSRVRRIKGQAEALERALEGDANCTAVLQQIAAIRGAVNGLMAGVLEDHIREHIGAADISTEARNAEIDQLVGILRSYLK